MKYYPALIRKTADSDFGIEFPDFPGCVSAGSSAEEATKMAEQALAFHVEGMRDDGEAIPLPSRLEDVLKSDTAADAALVLVPLARSKGRAVRFNATMDEYLLERADLAAKERGMTRSGLLATALRQYLEAYGDPPSTATDDAVEERHRAAVGAARSLADMKKAKLRENQTPDTASIAQSGDIRSK